jgi:hypothetical protein
MSGVQKGRDHLREKVLNTNSSLQLYHSNSGSEFLVETRQMLNFLKRFLAQSSLRTGSGLFGCTSGLHATILLL